ncbi:MAG: heme biosynthesis HemY N-terminal domain-containing protein [Pseudomonadota bacterium]
MIKALWFAVKVGALIALAVWVADRPGTVRVEWMEYTITVHMGLFLLAGLAFVLLTLFIYQTIKTFVGLPKSYARYSEIRARERGYRALTQGLTAVAAGDTKAAVAQAKKATSLLEGDTGLPMLLQAQAARLDGREEDATQSFLELLEDKDASFLGVRGLLQKALDAGDDEGALSLAQRALDLHPKQGWIVKILYDLQLKLEQWYAAEKTLTRAGKMGAVSQEKAKSDRVALYLAQAEHDMNAGHASDAVLMVKKALKFDPSFAPSSMMMADIYKKEGAQRKAQNVILKSWKADPKGALAAYWITLLEEGAQDDKLARLRWVEKLLKANSKSAAGQRIAGQAALDAGLWGEARVYFERAQDLGASVSLYKSWALLEELSGGDEEFIRELLGKAAGAPADKVWVCAETGNVYNRWHPVAQPHGSFNSISWDDPFKHSGPVLMLNDKAEMSEALIEAPDKPDTDAA